MEGLDLAHVRHALDRTPDLVDAPEVPRAAVAAVLTTDLDLLLMRRAPHDRDPWSGHVSFPGGRAEPSDADLLHTAVRETREELGFSLGDHQVIGALDEIGTISGLPPLVVRPYVFAVPERPALAPNHEVASVHWLSLHALLRNEGRTEFPLSYRGQQLQMPAVEFDGLRLWGLTLRMVDDLLHRLDEGGRGLERAPRPS